MDNKRLKNEPFKKKSVVTKTAVSDLDYSKNNFERLKA